MTEQYISPLSRALAIWKQGLGLPLTLAAELIAEGFNVEVLERKHRA